MCCTDPESVALPDAESPFILLSVLVFTGILMNMGSRLSSQDVARVCRALSAESRQEIVRLLAGRWLCVGALSQRLGMSAGAVSQHLRLLDDAGLVESDRRGTFIHYRVAPGAADRCRSAVDALFSSTEGGGSCVLKKKSANDRKN